MEEGLVLGLVAREVVVVIGSYDGVLGVFPFGKRSG